MRRFFLIAAIVSVLLLSVGCRETQTYRPSFTLGEGFSPTGETITGTVVGEEYYLLFDVLDTAERFVIFGDSAAETFLESGVIPLTRGENRFVIRLSETDWSGSTSFSYAIFRSAPCAWRRLRPTGRIISGSASTARPCGCSP